MIKLLQCNINIMIFIWVHSPSFVTKDSLLVHSNKSREQPTRGVTISTTYFTVAWKRSKKSQMHIVHTSILTYWSLTSFQYYRMINFFKIIITKWNRIRWIQRYDNRNDTGCNLRVDRINLSRREQVVIVHSFELV